MKRILILLAAVFLFSNAQAQEDDPQDAIQVLPEAAQKCTLPASPNAIPEEAVYDDLVNAKKQIAVFQGEVEVFLECLKADE